MIFVKCVVIGKSVLEFDVDRRVACLHQLQIHKKPACTSITVDKGMDALKLNMKAGKFGHKMLFVCGIIGKKLFHHRFDQIGLHRFMMCSQNANRNSSVYATVLFLVPKHERMNLLDDKVISLLPSHRQDRRLLYGLPLPCDPSRAFC